MTDLTHAPPLSLLERTRDLATMSEGELKRRGYLLPAMSRVMVYKRLESACRVRIGIDAQAR